MVVYLFLFVLFFRLSQEHILPSKSSLKNGDRIIIRSCLDSQPKLRFGKQTFYLAKVKIVAPSEPAYSFGDCLQVEGEVSSSQFWGSRSQGRTIFYLEDPEIKEWKKVPLTKSLFVSLEKFGLWLQEKAVRIYRCWLPEPEASLISGIVLGAKSALPRDFYEKLKITGTLHIVVASGYNLTVISRKPVGGLAWFVGRKMALVFGWLMIWGYVLVSGGEPPIIRAAIIISLVYLAQFLGKKFDVWRAFWLAIWLMLVIQPGLLTSISFQLSVAAMAGILIFSPESKFGLFRDKLQRLRKIPFVGKELTESLSAQLMVLPIIAYHFGEISWAAPLINMFVLPLVPYLMLLGLLGLIGLLWLPLAIPFLYLSYPLTWFFVKFINWTGRWSWLSLGIKP